MTYSRTDLIQIEKLRHHIKLILCITHTTFVKKVIAILSPKFGFPQMLLRILLMPVPLLLLTVLCGSITFVT